MSKLVRRINPGLRVILIGGSSNVGKTVLADTISKKLGWRCMSTDSLAKHPGRPWRQKREKVPDHLFDHYANSKADELVESIIAHHRKMSPIVAEVVRKTIKNNERLVLEGQALWPFITANYRLKEVAAVWLTASPQTLRSRVYDASGYENADDKGKAMISKFLERTIAFDERTVQLVSGNGCTVLDIDEYDKEQLVERVLDIFAPNR